LNRYLRLADLPIFFCVLLIGGATLITGCAPDPESSPVQKDEISSPAGPLATVTEIPSPTSTPYPDNRPLSSPDFFLGVDLSYVNEMDDCGAVYLENGEAQDAFELFQGHGAQLVRARLWHDPDWTEYSDLADIERTFSRAVESGMFTLLDFHYSDNWADPGKQAVPAAWKDLNDEELEQAVYAYTFESLLDLHDKGLMPDFVQVGNETNSGLLKQVAKLDWPRDAELFNAGIQAVRDAAEKTKTNPKIILHVAQPENTGWWFQNALENGITDFDIIGLSYYPQWSQFSITDVGAQVSYLRQIYQKDVMIVETAYLWTLEALDETASNILNRGVRGYPFSAEGQRQFMVDLSQSLISNGALGVVYWEPAWVSTQCSTRWGQGSHWENATFFDFNNNNEVHQGIDFLSYVYQFPVSLSDGAIEKAYREPLLQDPAGDNFGQAGHLDLISLHARDDLNFIHLGLTIGDNIFSDPWGSYLVYFDTTEDGFGADIDVGKRPISVSEPYLPEFRLDVSALDRKGTVNASLQLYAWDGIAWNPVTFTGAAAVHPGLPSVIELQISKGALGDPRFVNLGVVSTGRGRIHTAGDVMGNPVSVTDWKEPVTIEVFGRLDLSHPQ